MDKIPLRPLVDALNQLIGAYRNLNGEEPVAEFVGFGVDCGVPALIEFIILQAKAVCLLAESNDVFASAAAACARSAMEVGALAAWLAKPTDRHEREGRWLGYFKSLEDFYRKQAKDLKGRNPDEVKEANERLSNHLKTLCLPRFGREIIPVSKPSLRQMISDLGYDHLYAGYRELCEIIHGGPETIVRHRIPHQSWAVPMGFQFGVFRDSKLDWRIVFKMTGWGVGVSSYHCCRNSGFDNSKCSALIDAHEQLIKVVDRLN